MKRGCPCGCGRRPPIGERRRWATPECFVRAGQAEKRDVASVMKHDANGNEYWLR